MWGIVVSGPGFLRDTLETVKSEVPRALKREPAPVAFHQLAVVSPAHAQLHAVAAVYLEGDIVACGGMVAMRAGVVTGVVAAGDMCALGNDQGVDRKAWGVIISVPLVDPLDQRGRHDAENQKEEKGKQNRNEAKDHVISLLTKHENSPSSQFWDERPSFRGTTHIHAHRRALTLR